MNIIPKQTLVTLVFLSVLFTACNDDDDNTVDPVSTKSITIQNVIDSKPLVESGTFENTGDHQVFLPGESFSFQFSATKGQALTFATMYGWSNDMFFAPKNPGIQLYTEDGTPVEGDVSSQIKLWDNGSRINQVPGENVVHPGESEDTPNPITETEGVDAQGNTYPAAGELLKASIHYEGNSVFTLTVNNISGNTSNPTPFSPGVWAISYIVGEDLLNNAPLYMENELPENGITDIAEAGNNTMLSEYIQSQTGIFTPLSPILVVVYNSIENPIYKEGEEDAGNGLKEIAQKGDASILASYLENIDGVKQVYVLPATETNVLLPMIGEQAGSMVSQDYETTAGDKIAIATMYGFSNDWFFATTGEIDATQTGDISTKISLFDDGTAINEFPGAGFSQFNLGGDPQEENLSISEVPNPNVYTELPAIQDMIKVTIQ